MTACFAAAVESTPTAVVLEGITEKFLKEDKEIEKRYHELVELFNSNPPADIPEFVPETVAKWFIGTGALMLAHDQIAESLSDTMNAIIDNFKGNLTGFQNDNT